ncbi:MAG: RagB/SusD family nutrient uptake outer membrane protein, partial [Bacteroidales bacterium]|nr:RagB/SusD family nutrient uptake outer membrane protein [Candidatus Sodaliphilus fimicaballi]
MNKIFKYIVPAAALLLTGGLSSCLNDLHVEPIDPSLQTEVEPGQLFNKCYANFALAGNGGADGDCDVDGIDGGTSGLYRQFWNSQELPTDEAICGWGDEGVPSYCYNTYDASHPMLRGYYYRLANGVSYCNQYLKDFSDHDATMTAEIRFLRAFQFYLMMDAFGNIPFTTVISSDKPQQYSRTQMFEFIEGELLAIIGENKDDNSAILADDMPHRKGDDRYGRVDKAAAWLLLARLYLNAEVYTGTARWKDAETYAQKVVDSKYVLNTTGSVKEVEITEPGTTNTSKLDWEFTPYQMLFMGDNDKTTAAYEAIFPILSDGKRTTSWGVSLFLIASTHDGDMRDLRYDDFYMDDAKRAVNGVSGQAWGGNRARPELVRLFFPLDDAPAGLQAYDTYLAAGDDRALFCTAGREFNIADPGTFKQGFAVAKFNNLTTDGSMTSDATHPDMDVFMLR